MKTWRSTFRREKHSSEAESSTSSRHDSPLPVWVTHTPTPDAVSNDGDSEDDEATNSTGHTSGAPPGAKNMKARLKSLLPLSWNSVNKREGTEGDANAGPAPIQILPNGTRVSPPVSPLLERRTWGGSQGDSSQGSHKPLIRGSPTDDLFLHEESILSSIHPAEYYAAKVEVYKQKYSYLKSWPGLLRLLAGLQLLFGGMVFACVIAYIHKDSEWSNAYGRYNGVYNNGQGVSGYSYGGPMTPFVLAVAGISWILTMCLLVVGMTMYYRTILLDSPWWPLTEAFINVALFLLYMAAGIVYLNDLNRGGLCYMTIGVNPILSNLCRVDGGQMAGTAFLFINMALYLGSFLVCLKMWRHEAARMERQHFDEQVELSNTEESFAKRISFRDETDTPLNDQQNSQRSVPLQANRTEKSTHNPKVHVIADYIIKYPEITCLEEREMYKAVFNDQYQEYKELHKDISATLSKFRELDVMMERLPREGKNHEDPAFLEKKERCDYLKAKLSHIKNRIRTFDQET
uniref:Si:dkey-208k22.6 n=1 Tax=Salarias fasciatus TaxID=181472 RepID=A0A672J430_SALFA